MGGGRSFFPVFRRRERAWPRCLVAGLLLLPGPSTAWADRYPDRPIRVIVPTSAGSSPDLVARLLQPHLEKRLGQLIVIDNRAGASTIIGADAVAKAAADGYTLLLVPTTFTVNAALNSRLPFDPERDFAPIAIVVKNPLLFCVNARLPAHTLQEFVALAKAEPGKLNYATPGASSQAHLLIEMWSARAGIRLQHVPYRGGGPAALSVVAGETQLVLLSSTGMTSHIKSGAVRVLATGGAAREAELPAVPTVAEAGFPGFEAVQWVGLLAPGGTPREIVDTINSAVNRALRDPDLMENLGAQGTTAAGGTPEEFRALVSSELKNWKETAHRAGIHLE